MVDFPRPPRLSGVPLRNLARFARTRVGGLALHRVLRADLGVDELGALDDQLRGDVPLDTNVHPGRAPRALPSEGLPAPTPKAGRPA